MYVRPELTQYFLRGHISTAYTTSIKHIWLHPVLTLFYTRNLPNGQDGLSMEWMAGTSHQIQTIIVVLHDISQQQERKLLVIQLNVFLIIFHFQKRILTIIFVKKLQYLTQLLYSKSKPIPAQITDT